ncbi:MAG: M14 family metallopeptidase [bacterium]|nr:M14 family metallopeptidase [bacterium]
MKKEVLYTIPSLYRDDFRIQGYRFGSGQKALCVVGSLRGNEYQQIYTCSKLVKQLRQLEESGNLCEGKEILVIPSLNPGSMNIGKRFWPTDNTDINRMFPGYALGETTQRIAAGVFRIISEYQNGIQFASFYMPGKFCPHVRIMKTGYENVEKARQFGLPYIVLKVPRPYDTTTLNYNWQIWETDAFSLYGTTTERIDEESAQELVEAILRFLRANGIVKQEGNATMQGQRGKQDAEENDVRQNNVPDSHVLADRELVSVRPRYSGIFRGKIQVGERVKAGQLLAEILDACEGECLETLRAPVDGVVFFEHDNPMVYANTAAIKLLP